MKKHYTTIIVICCFLAMFVNQGFTSTSFNVYQTYIVAIPGVGDSGGSMVLSTRTLVSLIIMLFVNQFYTRFSTRWGVAISTVCTAIGFGIYAFWEAFEGFIVGSVFTGIGYGFGGLVAATLILDKWFNGRIGTAIGIVGMSTGIAGMVVPMIAASIIEAMGLQMAFFCEAVFAGAVALLCAVFLRSEPSDLGLQPFVPKESRKKKEGAKRPPVQLPRTNMSRGELVVVSGAMALLGAVAISANGYYSVLLTTAGLSAITAALLTSICGGCLGFGKLLCGFTFDKLGTRPATLIFFAIMLLGLLACGGVGWGGEPDGFISAVLVGLGLALANTGMSVWAIELSSPDRVMSNVRNFNVVYTAGGFLFNMVPGPLKELTGTYTTSYFIMFAFALVSAIVIVAVYTKRIAQAKREAGLQ